MNTEIYMNTHYKLSMLVICEKKFNINICCWGTYDEVYEINSNHEEEVNKLFEKQYHDHDIETVPSILVKVNAIGVKMGKTLSRLFWSGSTHNMGVCYYTDQPFESLPKIVSKNLYCGS